MCRSCSEVPSGRRCAPGPNTKAQGRAASARYYVRAKARRTIADLADAGIPAVDDLEMPPTYHCADEEHPLDLGKPPKDLSNEQSGTGNQKPVGALWAAPGRECENGGVRTTWSDHAVASAYGDPNRPVIELKPHPGAVVVHISSAADAENLLKRYNTNGERGPGFDWVAMRNDGIDGVYVDDRAVTAARKASDERYATTHPSRVPIQPIETLSSWDTSSVAWLSNDHLSIEGARESGGYQQRESDDDYGPTRYEMADDYGTSERPARPDLDTAWERVPKRFQPEPTEAPSTVYQPASDGAGGAPEREMDAFDLVGDALDVAYAVRSGKKKSKGKAKAKKR